LEARNDRLLAQKEAREAGVETVEEGEEEEASSEGDGEEGTERSGEEEEDANGETGRGN
jgi:hypothetical protein